MPVDLFRSVREYVLDAVNKPNLRVARQVGTKWTNQTVDLEYEHLCIRLTADRGAFEVYFGSTSDPLRWFNPSEIRTLLGLHPSALASTNVDKTLGELSELLERRLDQIAALFTPEAYRDTKRQLVLLADEQS